MKSKILGTLSTSQKLFFYSVFFFILFVSCGEIASRIIFRAFPYFNNPLGSTGYNPAISHYQRISQFVKAQGNPNCIFFGSSLTQVDIDPIIFEKAFSRETLRPTICYNAGMDGSKLSSSAPLALILSDIYKPEYVILGIYAGQFIRQIDQNTPLSPEERFSENSWVRYTLGRFNYEGWLIEHSSFYKGLQYIPRKMFPIRTTIADSRTHPEVPRTIISNGYGPLLGYRDASPLFQTSNSDKAEIIANEQDLMALQELIDQAQTGDFQLIVVEMPVNNPPQYAQDIVSTIKNYVRQRGIPFLSVKGLSPLPKYAYSDSIHMHIIGSKMFSEWLGAQLGQVVAQGLLSDIDNALWSPVSEVWWHDNYNTNFGLADGSYSKYVEYITSYGLLPHNALIFNPDKIRLDKTIAQSVLGFEIDWENGLREKDRNGFFQLIDILGRMRYSDELGLSSYQLEQLKQWRTTLEASHLTSLGIQYVLCRIELANQHIDHCPAGIADHLDYELIGTWNYPPLYEEYRLYHVK